MDPGRYPCLALERRGRLLEIRLDRPERLNAVNGAMHESLARVFADAALDEESDILLLTGSGKAFCAGGDADWLAGLAGDAAGFSRVAVEAKRIVFSLLDLEKPVVAKVAGPAVGLGATVALLADVVFAADTARIADPHVAIGLVAGDGGAVAWPQLVGFARAKHYLLTGDPVPAAEAERLGLIHKAVPGVELDAAVDAYCARLLTGAQSAIRWTKASLNIPLRQIAHQVMDACLGYETVSSTLPDHKEGLAAFRERRPPQFGQVAGGERP